MTKKNKKEETKNKLTKNKQRMPVCNKDGFSGVITVEMSYLIPIILALFLNVIYTTFYYHDKNILIGAASETAAVGAQMERKPDENGQTDLAGFYQERIQGKLILFSEAEASVSIEKKWVEVSSYADWGRLRLYVVQRAALQEPEAAIRRKWMLEKAVEAVKEKKGGADNTTQIEDKSSSQNKIGRTNSGQPNSGQVQIGRTGPGTVIESK